MGKSKHTLHKRLKASTLVELLITMVVSGIIFLLVFDGVGIIKQFSQSVNKRIEAGQTLLYSHQFMEHLMETADSVVNRDNILLFYTKGVVSDTLTVGDSFFVLESRGMADILFVGHAGYRIIPIPDTSHVDSLHIHCVVNAKDTIWLEYGQPIIRRAYVDNKEE